MKTEKNFMRALALTAVASGMASGVARADAAAPGEGGAPKKAASPRAPRVKGTVYVRVLHAIAAGPAADIYVDDKKVLTNVAYKTVSEYVPLDSGKRTFKATAGGATDALLTGSLSFTKDRYYTVAVYGTAAKPVLLRVDESGGPKAGTPAAAKAADKARLYVVHLAEGAPTVDVTTPSTRAKTGFANVMKGLTYGKSRTKTAAPGAMTLQVRVGDKVVKEQADVKTEAGKRYTVFAVGNAAATGAQGLDLIVKPSAVK